MNKDLEVLDVVLANLFVLHNKWKSNEDIAKEIRSAILYADRLHTAIAHTMYGNINNIFIPKYLNNNDLTELNR